MKVSPSSHITASIENTWKTNASTLNYRLTTYEPEPLRLNFCYHFTQCAGYTKKKEEEEEEKEEKWLRGSEALDRGAIQMNNNKVAVA